MMFNLSFFVVFSVYLVSQESYARVVPDFIKPCPELTKECLESTVRAILPDFVKGSVSAGLESLDPLIIDHVALTLPGNLKVDFDNGTVQGLGKCHVESISFENDEGIFNFLCNITAKGKYKAKGSLLIVTINGEGDARVKSKNVAMQVKIKFHDVVRDGVTYYEIKNFGITYNLGDKVTFQVSNLFQGSPELSQAVLQFLNENWKQVSEEFGGPIFKNLIDIVFNILNKFFKTVPKNEIVV